jgi:nucleoside-diphosphate-sugar epimerase
MGTSLVTGGAEFIGSNMVRFLLKQGERVRVLDNFETGKHKNLAEFAKQIELIEGDIRDMATVWNATGLTYITTDVHCHGSSASRAMLEIRHQFWMSGCRWK